MPIKGTVMQTGKALRNDRLRVSKASWKFRIIYNFAVIYPWNLFSWKLVYFLTVPIVFSVYKQNFTALITLKTRTAINAEISVFVIGVKVIISLLLHSLHGCTFKKNSE